jgi:translation elongation factor EF-G
MKACLFCCPTSITEHEGEPETFAQKVWDKVEHAVEKLDDKIDKIEEKIEDVLEKVVEAVQDTQESMLRAIGLDDKFKQVSDNTLDDVAPKAGVMVVDDAKTHIPAFESLDKATSKDITGEAQAGCQDTILSFRQKIHDFCDDVIEFLAEGIQGAVNCLHKVVSWILRACKEGVKFAVDMLKKVIPDCCEAACLSCMGLTAKLAHWIATVMNKLIDMVEDCIKAGLSAVGVPEWICEKVDFNGDNKPDPDKTDDSDEPLKTQKSRMTDGEPAPKQEEMEEPTV